MEKSVEWEFDTYMQEIFQMKEVDIKEYSPLTLAYIGDCIYDLIKDDAHDAGTSDRRRACSL